MEIAIAAVLAGFSLAIVAYPLFMLRHRGPLSGDAASPVQAALEFQAIRESIQALQLDYELGKVTSEQYQEQLQAYRLAAADALERQDQQQSANTSGPGTSVEAADTKER